jgi:hypothetical protein
MRQRSAPSSHDAALRLTGLLVLSTEYQLTTLQYREGDVEHSQQPMCGKVLDTTFPRLYHFVKAG